MTARLPTLIACLLLLAPLTATGHSAEETADPVDEFFVLEGVPNDLEEPWREFIQGWKAFGSWHYLVQEVVSLLLAAFLSALIAYHPRCRGDVEDPLSYERPKAMVVYGVVAAAIAEIVLYNPPMAFVVFGIGGLMRFRSVMGSPKDTGRTIAVAVVGLACGLKLFSLAVMMTAFGWILTQVLESRRLLRLELRKLQPDGIEAAAASYCQALEARGCRIRSLRKLPTKSRVVIVALVPHSQDSDELERSLGVPPELAGNATWEWPV